MKSKTKTKMKTKPRKIRKEIKYAGIVLAVMLVLAIALPFFSSLTFASSFRIVFGAVYVLFLPGFVISFFFFPKTKAFEEDEADGKQMTEKGAIDWIERIALSFALSIAIVPLAVFYLNLIGLKISVISSFFTILGIILLSLALLPLSRRIYKS